MAIQASIKRKEAIKLEFDWENYFNELLSGHNPSPGKKYTTEDELDDLYAEYQDLVSSLKEEGYKIMRNSLGKHKMVKNE